jgi:hypothetical protein
VDWILNIACLEMNPTNLDKFNYGNECLLAPIKVEIPRFWAWIATESGK